MSFCSMCGKENVTQSPFCLNCGANLSKSESPAPVTENKEYQLPPVQPQMRYAQPLPQPAAYAPAPKKPVNKKLIGRNNRQKAQQHYPFGR